MPRSSRFGAIPSDLAWLIDELDSLSARLDTLEAPSGEALSSTVAKLEALVTDIQAQLDAWVLTRWTNAEITTEINNAVSSGVAAGLAASGTIGGNITIGGEFRSPNAYAFDITYTRRTAWLGNDGRLGWASSSATKKTAIEPADEAHLLRLLDAVPKTFLYRAEIRRRSTLRINAGIDYAPPRELGLIAEELDALGLHEFLIYDEDGAPEGIEYGMLTVALLAIARDHETRLRRLESGAL